MSEDDMPNPKARGLGRGLNALFEDDEDIAVTTAPEGSVAAAQAAVPDEGHEDHEEDVSRETRRRVSVALLRPGFSQPRQNFPEETLEALAQSIITHGLLQPILVRVHPTNIGEFEIIAGERRWRAAQLAQMHEVPVIIRDMTDAQALEIALVENLQREDLNPVDEALAYKRLMDEYDHTQVQLAEALGRSRSHIANMTRLLSLSPGALKALEEGKLSIGHARALITLENADEIAEEVIKHDLSVRQTEALVNGLTGKKSIAGAKNAKAPVHRDPNIEALEKDLEDILGLNISIQARGNSGEKGTVTLNYGSLAQLDEILKIFTSAAQIKRLKD